MVLEDLWFPPGNHLAALKGDRAGRHKVGAHRRVRAQVILDYCRKTESRRRKALDELTAVDQELSLQ